MKLWHSKIILYWLIIITIIPFVASIQVPFYKFLSGLALVWLMFGFLFYGINKGFYKNKKLNTIKNIHLYALYNKRLISFFIALMFLVFVPIYIKFYTGKGIGAVLITFVLGGSNYMDYQDYFKDSGLNEFSLNKLPFVLLNGIFKFLITLLVLRIIVFQSKIKFIDYCSLFFVLIGLLYSSLGRGTSFEIFELMLFFLFAFLMKIQMRSIKFKISYKTKIILSIIGLSALYLFSLNLSLRGVEGNCAGNGFCLDKDSVLYTLSPFLGFSSYYLAAYFAFPIYFLSSMINDFIFSSVESFLIFISPLGILLSKFDGYRDIICDNFIECGASWNPDLSNLFGFLGFVGTIPFLIYLGKFSTKIYLKVSQGEFTALPLFFFIMYYFISLPVGNFITVSSSNILAIIISFVYYKNKGFGLILKKYSKTINLSYAQK